MHEKLIAIVATVGVCILVSKAAQGNETWLGDPPHIGFPGWVTSSPYQRNIYLDFSVDPLDPLGPGSQRRTKPN